MANNRLGIPVFLLFFISSCSIVKENRDSCPCNLIVEITGVQDASAMLLVKSVRDSSYTELVSVSRDSVMTLYVPRGGVSLSAWSGTSVPLPIPCGSQSPPLYLYHGHVDTRGDMAHADIRLHKQFCTLSLEVEGPPGWGTPIGTAIRGSACGMSLSGGILPGEFTCSPSGSFTEPQDNGTAVYIGAVRLPRQHPDSQLMLDIVMEDNVIRSFSLGPYLREASYDWTATDLPDITVHMNLSVNAVTFTTPGQTEPVSLTVDI